MSMRAAVVRSFEHPPRYEIYDVPKATGPDDTLVEVVAAGLHPRVRSGAAGRHYTSTGTLPMIPGVDGVGRLEDGGRVYFVVPDDAWGSMAERAIVDRRRSIPLPESVDAAKVAAAMNPAMSAWVALRRRVPLQAGQSVLILGATGNAGGMAVQVAKRLGAGRVVGAGRNPERLERLAALGADEVVALVDDPAVTAERLATAAADVDIVIDYLWGKPGSCGHHGAARGPDRSQPGPRLDSDRGHGRPHHRVAVGGAPIGQSPNPGKRPRCGVTSGLLGRTAIAGRRDRGRDHRGRRPFGAAGRRRSDMERARDPRTSYRLRSLESSGLDKGQQIGVDRLGLGPQPSGRRPLCL